MKLRLDSLFHWQKNLGKIKVLRIIFRVLQTLVQGFPKVLFHVQVSQDDPHMHTGIGKYKWPDMESKIHMLVLT